MTVRQVIELARSSELNGLPAVSGNVDVILGFLNLGMLELHKRFAIKQEECVLDLVDGVDVYTLPEDCMWLVKAYGEVDIRSTDIVNILPINKEDDPLSINTFGFGKVQVPVSVQGAHVSLIYVASPKVYDNTMLDNVLEIPVQFVDPLLAYIGYKGNSTIDSGVNSEDSVYFARYEASCNRIEDRTMFTSDDMYMDDRLNARGFV